MTPRRLGYGLLCAAVAGAAFAAPAGAVGAGAEPGRSFEPAGSRPAADTVVLRGIVRAPGVRPDGVLPGALVEIRQGSRKRTVVSDERGAYRAAGLEPGATRVQVFHLATHPLELDLRLPARGEMSVDLELEARVLALAGVEIVGAGRAVPTAPVGLREVSGRLASGGAARALEGSSGMVESGLVQALGPLTTDEDSGSGRVLFMRGSTIDARTVLLDGAPVLTPFHVAGLVAPFEPELLGESSFHPGGAPPRYGGGLSYLVDVTTRRPRTEGSGGMLALDGLLWKGVAETALPGGGGLLVASRSLHGRQSTLGSREYFPYRYDDLLLRGVASLGGGHEVALTAYRNDEGVRLDEVLVEDGQARWGNRAGSVSWAGQVGPVGFSAVSAASRYESSLPLVWREPVVARASSHRARTAVDLVIPMDGWRLAVGGSGDRFLYRYRLDPLGGERQSLVAGAPVEMGVDALGAYAEASVPLGERVRIEAGLRADAYAGEGPIRLGPRASIRALLTDDAALSVTAGRYHQPVPMPGLAGEEAGEDYAALFWNPRLPIASATHLVLTLEQVLDERLELGVSGFVKSFDRIDAPGTSGRVSSSGTDLRVARQGDRLGAWVGYALSWFWEEEGAAGSSTFRGRHLVSAGLRAAPYEGIDAGLTLGYGAGLPFASLPLPGEAPMGGVPTFQNADGGVRAISSPNAGAAPLDVAPEDDFLRLDLDVRWSVEPTIAGRRARLRPYLRVMNALDSRDALFQYLDRWRDGEIRPVAERPFLPIVGLEWRF